MASRSRPTDTPTEDGFNQLYDDVFKSFVENDVDISSDSLSAGISSFPRSTESSYDHFEEEDLRHPYSSARSPQSQPREIPSPRPPPLPPVPQIRQQSAVPQSPRQQARRPLPRPPGSDPTSATSYFFPMDKKQPLVTSPISDSYPYGDLNISDSHITRSASLSPPHPSHHQVARHGTYAPGFESSRFNSPPQFTRPPGAALPTPPSAGYYPNGNGLRSTPDVRYNSSETSLNAPNIARHTSFGSASVSSGQYSIESPAPHSIHQVHRAITDLSSNYERDSFYGPTPNEITDGYNDDTIIGPGATITPPTSISRGNSLAVSDSSSPVVESPSAIVKPPSISVQQTTPVHRHHGHDGNRNAESSRMARHQEELQRTIASIKGAVPMPDEDEDFDEDIDEDPDRFVMLSLLSHLAVRLRDKVPRSTHVKGGIPYHRAFTGKDIVSTIQSQIQRELLINMGISTNDRRIALGVARSLQSQLFFYEVEWGGRQLTDSVEDVYMFLDDQEGVSNETQPQELPTAVITILTKLDVRGERRQSLPKSLELPIEAPEKASHDRWSDSVEPQILRTLPASEIKRQGVIRKVIEKEEQYVQDLDIIESLFIKPLRQNDPEVIPPEELDSFIDTVFGNVLDLRECNRRLLETMYVRQREQAPIIQRIGDIFLTAAAEFRLPYPDYVGHLPLAEKRMKDELENNQEFRRFHETCTRHPSARRFDLRHFITRPSEHLQRYPILLEAIYKDTTEGNPDADFLQEAIQAIRKLSGVAHVRTFQTAMLRGPTAKLEWHDLVSSEIRESMTKQEVTKQSQIFELIKGEMEYVKDLQSLDTIFIQPLRKANPPIIPRERLPQFIEDVFYNFGEILKHHKRMLEKLHEIQLEEHPVIHSVTATIFDAALNWRDAYMDFIPHYPIAAYRIDEELANNPSFKTFVEQCTRHVESRKLDIKAFVYRPIPRLLRYDLLLKGILSASPADHEDKEAIPQVLEVIKALGRDSEPGVVSAKQKVELWKYNANLVFKPGEYVDMDLLDENRTLIHAGKLLRQADAGFEWNGWSELFVLLFDNYMVITKPKDKDGVMKYHVNRHPIPLDLLNIVNFTDPPQTRGTGLLRGLQRGGRGGTGTTDEAGFNSNLNGADLVNATDSRTVYPCTIHHNGRIGGLYTLYAESAQSRAEWKTKLEEALVLRKTVTDNNKVFELETLSADTFLVPSLQNQSNAAWNQEQVLTGKVTCSVPFYSQIATADGMRLVAVGCAEGVWIGLRHDSKSMRRVLHLKAVTQCAMLEDFGIFLVLADKSLWAYHIEALVPSGPPRPNLARTPQKLNNHKDVQFFSVGTMNGRTLLIYMKKKGTESIFHVLEPVGGKITDKPKAPATFGRSLFGSQRSDWFRHYREFFLPTEATDVYFLKNRIAVLCTRGFEIMELSDYTSVSIPQRDDARLAALAKRCESSRPLEFGLYVDRFGDPCRGNNNIIEWEGTAERVSFHPPHVCLFDPRFIEIRHIDTGRLAQIIHGTEIRCIWDGRGTNVPQLGNAPGPNGWQDSPSQEPRIHAVMRAPELPRAPGVRAPPVFVQQVVELIPTIPLYLPGSLSSPPSTATYFNHSPPGSPRASTARWR
ncbi:hypothetical protein Clacol_005400 [Clathrus columnatus]|uniref:Uncharacterized protein n=1 Tax=Clathrus columnatus TaxID=1419009 RepID=A0AAV5ADG2_9AGAM|nr:hypothetical protein Clacol_005400 [Clathrus columnatus]